jgi:hypothetical protein
MMGPIGNRNRNRNYGQSSGMREQSPQGPPGMPYQSSTAAHRLNGQDPPAALATESTAGAA